MCLRCERAGSAVVRSQCAKRPVGSSTPDLAPGHSPHNIILFSLHVISSGCLSRMEPQKECDASVAYGVMNSDDLKKDTVLSLCVVVGLEVCV